MSNVASWIDNNSNFADVYRNILHTSLCSQLGDNFIPNKALAIDDIDWDYALNCASFLAYSTDDAHQELALRIASTGIAEVKLNDVLKARCVVILDSLQNRPSIELAKHKEYIPQELLQQLPTSVKLQWFKNTISSRVVRSDGKEIFTNKFQKQVWDAAERYDWVSVSAPTSAGKSYIITQWLIDYLLQTTHSNIVYLVPTRALINQVIMDLRGAAKGIPDINITGVPIQTSLEMGKRNILVFTQERLHLFLSSFHEDAPQIDVMIIDEAQKLADGARGVLLQDAIDRCLNDTHVKKIIFASPFTDNPEDLLLDIPDGKSKDSFINTDRMVNQNIFWLSQVSLKPKVWEASVWHDNQEENLGIVELPYTPSSSGFKRLTCVAHAIGGDNAGNIVFANRPFDAEKTALLLKDLVENFELNQDVKDLINLVKHQIHPKFSLIKSLEKGIAFHYGNMPQLIRSEIERLFAENKILYLVCTSTLVEGVNMSCKNIFIRGPKRGQSNLMPPEDFWNLAGRAGRWGKEFQGNVFCIDANNPSIWHDGQPPSRRSSIHVEKVTDKVMSRASNFADFIDAGTPRDVINKNPDYEYVLSYLVVQKKRFGDILNTPWAKRFSSTELLKLEDALDNFIGKLEIPHDLIIRNPGINPSWMDDLLQYFETRGREPEEYMPADPSSMDAADNYGVIFSRTYKYLNSSLLGPSKRAFVLGLMVSEWMRGRPLSRLISSRVKYYKDKNKPHNIATLIREVMRDVEQVARFAAPKYLCCYSDILRFYLQKIERYDLVEQLKDLGIFLEFGVAQVTQISLMSLGLSRTTAISLSEFIANDEMSEADVLEWLSKEGYSDLPLPTLVVKEIDAVLNIHRDEETISS